MKETIKIFTVLVCLIALCCGVALAQREAGQISGTVRDPSGAVIAAAKITVKSTTTGQTRTATTNVSGIYTIASLSVGTYDVTIEKSGFEKVGQRVEVSVGSTNDISAQLKVGATTSKVEVVESFEAVSVNTETQTLSQIVTSKQIDVLPTTPSRDPYALVATAGNVTEDNQSARGAGFAINGQRSDSTSILLDGAENVDTFDATVGQPIPLDSVEEFSVLTNNFTAEYGRASGGVVNLITKSGTNVFHGSAYEFNRLSALSSNTFNNNAYARISIFGS